MSLELPFLRNTYFGLRHGKGLANAQEIIVSDPVLGVREYGLIPEGELEVERAVSELKEAGILDEHTIIVSGYFRRHRESSKIAARVLGVAKLIFVPALRERFFGRFEGRSNAHYKEVWERDAEDPTHTYQGVESAQHVRDRICPLVSSLEEEFSLRNILFTSSGDPLQIGETAFKEKPVSEHRSLPHWNTGEIRQLNRVTHAE